MSKFAFLSIGKCLLADEDSVSLIQKDALHHTITKYQTSVSGQGGAEEVGVRQDCTLNWETVCATITDHNVCKENEKNITGQEWKEWMACPYQVPGNWRWTPIFEDEIAVRCVPPQDGEQNYGNTSTYNSSQWDTCSGEKIAGLRADLKACKTTSAPTTAPTTAPTAACLTPAPPATENRCNNMQRRVCREQRTECRMQQRMECAAAAACEAPCPSNGCGCGTGPP